MKHVPAIAGRELRGFFRSPLAYVVLTLWSLLAATVFLSSLLAFQDELVRAQQFQAFDHLRQMNLNDQLILPFIGTMWVVLLFLIPAVTMGLFANEKQNGTEELLLTSPITIWEIVLGKFLAAGAFVLIMTAIVGFYPLLLAFYGDPELGKTAASLIGMLLVSLAYVAVGAFASSLTRNQLIAFVISLVLLFVFGLMLPYIVELSVGDGGTGVAGSISSVMRYVATGEHFDNLLRGLVDTADLAYFAIIIAVFLVLAKTAVESVRWR